jgi:hypothetical protein
MKADAYPILGISVALGLLGALGAPGQADASALLGSAASFAILGASTVTNTGPTKISGDLGLSPGTSITGFSGGPGSVVNGTVEQTTGAAAAGQVDALTAFNTLAALPFTTDLTNTNLGNRTLTPGVYFLSDTTALLDGTLTLDAKGNPDALFVFQLAHALTTGSSSAVTVINGGPDDGIYWDVGSIATLGSSAIFLGNILADAVTLDPSAAISCGRAIALTAAVTLDDNVVTSDCGSGVDSKDFGSQGFSGSFEVSGGRIVPVATAFAAGPEGGPTTVPEPITLALFVGPLAGIGLLRRRGRLQGLSAPRHPAW